jgi:hypothetical protein
VSKILLPTLNKVSATVESTWYQIRLGKYIIVKARQGAGGEDSV